MERAVESSILTATLRWTAPSAAVTTTIRYARERIAERDWSEALPLADDVTGGDGFFTAIVPYDGRTVYFALKTQNAAGDWSALSNNAFWPSRRVFLPLIVRW